MPAAVTRREPASRASAPPARPDSGISASGRVPAEYIGLGRALREKIRRAQVTEEAEIEALLWPLRPRPAWTPPGAVKWLRDLAERYRALQHACRLRVVVGVENRRLRLADLRVRASRMQFPGWGDDAGEPAISITLRTLVTRPYREEATLLADIGLHGLARRFERGWPNDDRSVLADLRVLAAAFRLVIKADDPEFRILTPSGGAWIGRVTTVGGDKALAVRTFVDG